MEEIVNF